MNKYADVGSAEKTIELRDFLFRHEYLFRQQVSMFYPLSFELMERHADIWSFSLLSLNTEIDWNNKTIAWFEKYIDWFGLSGNAGVVWSEEILDRYQSDINWHRLSANPSFPITDIILEKYTLHINWIFLSTNPSLPIDDTFLEKYEAKINWQILKNYNNNLDNIGQKFQQKISDLPENKIRSPYPLPDIVSRYVRWNAQAALSEDEFIRVMPDAISQVSDLLLDKYRHLWDWRHIGGCIHLNWSIPLFEHFYGNLGQEVTRNIAFYNLVIKPYLNDEIIDTLCDKLNPEKAVNFYYIEDKNDEYGMLPQVRFTPQEPGDDSFRRSVYKEYFAQFSSNTFCTALPEVKYELSWFLRHPVRYADYHGWPIAEHYPAIIVSPRVKEVLERFNLPPHKFYPINLEITDVTFGLDSRTYYIFHVPEQDYLYYEYTRVVFTEDQDRKQESNFGPHHHRPYYDSSYFNRQKAPKYPVKINTPDEFLIARDSLQKSDPLKRLRPQEYIWKADLDVISSSAENPRRSIWISEAVKKALEAASVTGMRFERVWECRPRMLGVETPEHRLKNSNIVNELSAEYQSRLPEPEQVTIENFKKAEVWAEAVRQNKGIVNRMRISDPPFVVQDDFITRVRRKEEELDVVFPDWFVDIMRDQQLPEILENYQIKSLDSLICFMISEDFPPSVKSVVFAECGTEVLFLALKKDSFFELDDVIYTHEYDQGPPPRIKMRMD